MKTFLLLPPLFALFGYRPFNEYLPSMRASGVTL